MSGLTGCCILVLLISPMQTQPGGEDGCLHFWNSGSWEHGRFDSLLSGTTGTTLWGKDGVRPAQVKCQEMASEQMSCLVYCIQYCWHASLVFVLHTLSLHPVLHAFGAHMAQDKSKALFIHEHYIYQQVSLLCRHWLFDLCRGIEFEAVKPRQLPKSIGCSKNFPGKTSLAKKEQVQPISSNSWFCNDPVGIKCVQFCMF